ncbi:transient receptor potential cation channel subfamily M member 5-like [Nerophis ophidion]|uniref:transient receptor potential cation channel subfamily M member 5-like n=1 Tax=Nerophis ophidion TaxID=159077 RepID=UPI002AE09EF8|nr:transient receptor potential cation channel subfamily M member 5-like [Nerophis ophidion]
MKAAEKQKEVLVKSPSKKEKDQSWIPNIIKKRVCTAFVEDSSSDGELCLCGGVRNLHNTFPEEKEETEESPDAVHLWDSSKHTTECPTDAFGELEFAGASCRHSYFLRLSCDTPPQKIYTLLTTHWRLPSPNLVVSVVGGEGRETIKTWVRDVLRNGLVRVAQSTGAWIFTGGLREGVARCVGEAVRDHSAAASKLSKKKVIAVGIAPWGIVFDRQHLVNAEGSFPARYYVQNTAHDSCLLDNNHQAFLLVDDGSSGRRGGETAFRAGLEGHISHQRTGILGSGSIEIPVLCMLISGDASMLKRLENSLNKSTPWLVLANTGPAANLISELLMTLPCIAISPSSFEAGDMDCICMDIRDRIHDKIQKHFPNESDQDKLVDSALTILFNRELITVFHAEQGLDEFDNVLLKALVRASKRLSSDASEYTEELKLAVAWNRVDIAKTELFTGNILWKYDDLEGSMTDALVNDKPQFVRLFCENGLNILDYLTYQRLESLYRSLSDSCVAYVLLQRRLSDRLSLDGSRPSLNGVIGAPRLSTQSATSGPASGNDLSLFEVSRVLWDLLGDVCQPFYYEPLGLDFKIGSSKALRQVNKMLHGGNCAYRDQRCHSPWAALYIWAILQNRSEMAVYFWEMAGESVMCALGGCKLLRELSHLESENESKAAMKELAQKFEDLAHDVFGECYQSSERRSFTLLIRKSPVWVGATCLQMATAADARLFFSHDGVQSLLSQIWWGSMDRTTEAWKLVIAFFMPPLIFIDFISFRQQEDEDNPVVVQVNLKDADILEDNDGVVFPLADIVHKDEEADESQALKENLTSSSTSDIRTPPFIVTRWRQFCGAPVTTFLGNVLMYFLFLCLFAYILLVDFKPPPPKGPSSLEFVLYFWVFTLVCEEIRQIFFVSSNFMLQGMKSYIKDIWNQCDVTAITIFICALGCRMFPQSFKFGRALMAIDFMVFTLRLIHIFAAHKQLGPKIIIVGKMMKDIFFFLFFLTVWVIAYGVANQALLYSYDPRPNWIFRRVFYRPYLYIFGLIDVQEVDADLIGDKSCTNNVTLIEAGHEPCTNADVNWLVIVLLVIYLLVTNILLINLLIAMFSFTFNEVQERSDIYWKFQRYNLIVEYHSRPSMAPPFIIISHIILFIKRIVRHIPSEKTKHFVLDLPDIKASQINMWEAIQKENLLSAENKRHRDSDTERLKRTSFKVDNVLKKMNAHHDHDQRLQLLETEMEYCCNSLSWMMEAMSQSNIIKANRPPPVLRDLSPS